MKRLFLAIAVFVIAVCSGSVLAQPVHAITGEYLGLSSTGIGAHFTYGLNGEPNPDSAWTVLNSTGMISGHAVWQARLIGGASVAAIAGSGGHLPDYVYLGLPYAAAPSALVPWIQAFHTSGGSVTDGKTVVLPDTTGLDGSKYLRSDYTWGTPSGLAAPQTLQAEVTLNSSQIDQLLETPDTILTAIPDTCYILDGFTFTILTTGHTAFSDGSNFIVYAASGGGTTPYHVNYTFNDTVDMVGDGVPTTNGNTGPLNQSINQPIILTVQGADYTGGSGSSGVFTILYHKVKLP